MTIIFDGNYLFYKTLFVFGSYGSGRLLETKTDQDMFIRKIATDMAYAVRTFGVPERVIFTVDSKSWRKEIAIQDGEYKGNRTKDGSTIDWDKFYLCMNEFTQILENKGFIVSRVERAEGDDLMYLWTNAILETGKDSVIVTGDRDMNQTVELKGENFIVVYNSNSKLRKIIAPKGYTEWLKEEHIDIFNASSYMGRGRDLVQKALSAVEIQEVDPAYVIFEKVIMGDAGDAVPPIWTWTKESKTYRITPAKAARIYEIINLRHPLTDIYDLPDRAAEVANAITDVTKQTPPVDVIEHNLRRNLQLVYLDKRIIPQDIQDAFKEEWEANANSKSPSIKSYDMHSILEGTRFISGGKTFEASIFSELDKLL